MIDPRVTGFPGTTGNVVMGGVRPPETTGRQIVVFADGDDDTPIDLSAAGIANVADSRDFSDGEVSARRPRGGRRDGLRRARHRRRLGRRGADECAAGRHRVGAPGAVGVAGADPPRAAGERPGVRPGLPRRRGRPRGPPDAHQRARHGAPGRPDPADLRRHPAGDVGHPGGAGDVVVQVRQGHPGRRPGHRVRHHPPRLRRTQRHRAVLRGGGAPAGRARARDALHRHVLRAAHAVHRPAVRHRLRGRHLRRQGAQQRRQRLGRADPRGHQLGGHQPLPGAVDVPRRRRGAWPTRRTRRPAPGRCRRAR